MKVMNFYIYEKKCSFSFLLVETSSKMFKKITFYSYEVESRLVLCGKCWQAFLVLKCTYQIVFEIP